MLKCIQEFHMKKTWRVPDEILDADAFCSIDPGKKGGGVLFSRDGAPLKFMPLHSAHDASIMGNACLELGVTVLVVENQFYSKDAQALIRLARFGGIISGVICASMGSENSSIVWVSPQTWQTGAFYINPRAQSYMRKQMALSHTEKVLGAPFSRMPKYKKEGIADAFCMGEWWASLLSRKRKMRLHCA